jgi:hypothetical protein
MLANKQGQQLVSSLLFCKIYKLNEQEKMFSVRISVAATLLLQYQSSIVIARIEATKTNSVA